MHIIIFSSYLVSLDSFLVNLEYNSTEASSSGRGRGRFCNITLLHMNTQLFSFFVYILLPEDFPSELLSDCGISLIPSFVFFELLFMPKQFAYICELFWHEQQFAKAVKQVF